MNVNELVKASNLGMAGQECERKSKQHCSAMRRINATAHLSSHSVELLAAPCPSHRKLFKVNAIR